MRYILLFGALIIFEATFAQLVEVRADYNAVGDCIFSAYNNSPTPLFLNIDFADLENTSFNETLPYIKLLEPGFNSLFTLERYPDEDVPRFNYKIKTFRSDPFAAVDLDFPYLIPFKEGSFARAKDVSDIAGFWGTKEPDSWVATAFIANPGDEVYACRQGIVVEISGRNKEGDQQYWYNTWNNAITLLQPDGTLICYKNVIDKNGTLKRNEKIYSGQQLGLVEDHACEVIILIYQNSITSSDPRFILPQFAINEKEMEIANKAKQYVVQHPKTVRGLEMSKKEKRKILGIK